MPLIIGLGLYFLAAFILALAYQFYRKRSATVAVHYAAVFGFAVTLVVYVLAIALDIADITPEPSVSGGS